ncbi:MAG: histidinol-phosphate transaminase [Elusimicrobia bacterium]|nr:histidinol-phosphate transaminase [Elusimicrobiota bacterium]
MDILPRRSLREVTPFFAEQPNEAIRLELGLKEIVRLCSNESPLGPSPKALAAYRDAAKLLSCYPDGGSPDLCLYLAKRYKVGRESVLVGSGSDEIIRMFCEAFLDADDEVIVSQHGFIRFRQQAVMMGARIIEIPMSDWTSDLETMARAASPRTKLVFLANPNNPTGTYNTQGELRDFLRALPAATLVVIDEAFYDFASENDDYPRTLPQLVRQHPNLVILRTFSQAYGLAGLRVGYAVGDPEVLGWLDRIRLPFNVNLPAQRACLAALEDEEFLARTVALSIKGRESLAGELRELGLGVLDSATNFLFVRSRVRGRALSRALFKKGIVIHPLDEYGLGEHVRISVGTAQQNAALVKALKDIMAREPGGKQGADRA